MKNFFAEAKRPVDCFSSFCTFAVSAVVVGRPRAKVMQTTKTNSFRGCIFSESALTTFHQYDDNIGSSLQTLVRWKKGVRRLMLTCT